jgi:hypothetical protein
MPAPYREPVPVDPEPAPDPAAALSRLGALLSRHAPPPLHRALLGPVLIAGLLVGLAAVADAPIVLLLPIGAAAFTALAWSSLQLRGVSADLHAQGLVLAEDGVRHVVAFEDVDEVWFEIDTFQNQSGAHLRALRLRDFAGAVHRLPLALQGAPALVGAVLRACQGPLLAEARQALREGETLTFAKVRLDRQGITVGDARRPWSQIRLATLERGKVYLFGRLPLLAWRTVSLEEVPNPSVFFGLVAASVTRTRMDDQLLVPLATGADVSQAQAAQAAAGGQELALRNMLVGGVLFLAGAIITWTTYSANNHAYVLAYGPLLFGGVRFVQGLRAYLARPPR